MNLPGQRSSAPSVLADLAQALTAAVPEPGSIRAKVQQLLERAPVEFDHWWQAAKHMPDGPIDVIDLFSGCGGMSAGFRAVNGIAATFRHILSIDIDPLSNKTYDRNIPLKSINEDLHKLASDPSRLDDLIAQSSRRAANPLVLIGCAPCQGFSSHRNGAADDRNELFSDFAKIAVRLQPDFILIENVPELCTDQHWSKVENVRHLFTSHGYRVHLAIHNFAEFGLPQERFRALMIAARQPFDPPAGILARSNFRTVREAIGNLPPISPGNVDPFDPMHYTANHRQSTIDMIKTVPKDGGKRSFSTGPNSLITLQARQGKPAFEDVYGRLYWDRPAITITSSSRNPASGRFVHPEQHRGLSIREAALLQGFPRDYAFAGGFDHRFQQVGNAVPPLVAVNLALTLLRELLAPPTDGPGPGVTEPLARSFARLIPTLKSRSAQPPFPTPSTRMDMPCG
jgi:DNA (cytosine-5)-methyltransferase 1